MRTTKQQSEQHNDLHTINITFRGGSQTTADYLHAFTIIFTAHRHTTALCLAIIILNGTDCMKKKKNGPQERHMGEKFPQLINAFASTGLTEAIGLILKEKANYYH